MNKNQKVLEIYDTLMINTDSFEPFAIYLAYLFPAILKGTWVDVDYYDPKGRKFWNVLSDNFSNDHFVWNYVKKS